MHRCGVPGRSGLPASQLALFLRSAAEELLDAGRVFSTSSGAQPGAPGDGHAPAEHRRSRPVECASESMTSFTPRSRASRACASLRSSRSTWQLISSATPARGRGVDDPRRCRRVAVAPQQQAAGRMAEDVHPRALDRAQHALGHLRLVLVERRVDRGDDDVELREAVVGEIERAVGRMSHSMPASSRMPSSRASSARTRARVLERRGFVEAVGHRERLAVVGDREVCEARRPRRARHRLQRRRGRRSRSCAVQVAAQVAALDQARQRARSAAASISPRFSRSSGGTNARPSAS